MFQYVLQTEEAGIEIMYPSNLSSLIRTMDKNKRVLTDLMHFPHFRECLFLYSVANGKKDARSFFLCVHNGFNNRESQLSKQSSDFYSYQGQWVMQNI